MAEYGAHITATSQYKPSIFDVVAQESLLESLQPAMKHALKIIAEKNPAKFGWCFRYADEIYFYLHAVLQAHYLSTYGASFSENFYDLKRQPIKDNMKTSKPLSLHPQIYAKSLAALTIVPYIRHHLELKYHKLIEEETNDFSNGNISGKLKMFYKHIWPIVHFLIETTALIYYVRYLLGKSKVHSPILQICGVSLACLTEDDFSFLEQRSQKLSFANVRSIRGFYRWAIEIVGSCVQNSLEVGAFFLQFLDWFYSNNSSSSKIFASNPIPLPPLKPDKVDLTRCPICNQEWKQETVLAVSGYVFCYSCILLYVREHNTCPVTNYPATTKQLIKIYKY